MQYDTKAVESKWIRRWETAGTFKAETDFSKSHFYALDTWAYPSAEGVHIGYVKSFGGMDVIARYKRMKGFNVLYPTGWDTLGLPAENYAIKSGRHPREITDESIRHFQEQYRAFGLSYDWSREINTADPSYYKWTQWLFLLMYRHGLAYRKLSQVTWCPKDMTVIAKEQVTDGRCERCGSEILEKELMQWYFKVTAYADRLFEDCDKLDWEEKYLQIHRKWIGKEIADDGTLSFHLHDWCVSRQRYWGPPIPIVYCDCCGVVPVTDDRLPVMLPYNVAFTPTGSAPLAKNKDFVQTHCPACGGTATRETDTLDTFVSSAWYQFRFMNPFDQESAVNQAASAYWKQVDHYQGTIEHLTAHLVYARFVTKVLYDHGYVAVDEPFPKYTPVGLLVDKTGEKFSKRLGNAPNTDALIEKYGGDLLRLSCYFISPFDEVTKWGEEDVVAVERFRNRVWHIFVEKVDKQSHTMPEELIVLLHQTIRDVGRMIEEMKFNVAISRLMVLVGALQKYDGMIDQEYWASVVKLLAPFTPFFAEEIWSMMGQTDSVHHAKWPEYDQLILHEEMVAVVVQVNGKYRGVVLVKQGSVETVVVKVVMKEFPKINPALFNFKTIFVTDKVINFVLE